MEIVKIVESIIGHQMMNENVLRIHVPVIRLEYMEAIVRIVIGKVNLMRLQRYVL